MANPSRPGDLSDAKHMISELQTALAAKEKELKAARKFNLDQLIKKRETEQALRILKEQVGETPPNPRDMSDMQTIESSPKPTTRRPQPKQRAVVVPPLKTILAQT